MEPDAQARNGQVEALSLTYALADQSFAQTKSLGILDFSLELLQALVVRPEVGRMTVLANRMLAADAGLPPGPTVELYHRPTSGRLGRIAWDQWGAYRAAARAGNQWLLLPKGFASFVRPCPMRLAVFVHDLMQEHYDRHHPGGMPAFEGIYFRAALRASFRRAALVFVQTEFVKAEVERWARERGLAIPHIVCCGRGLRRAPAVAASERRDVLVFASRLPHKLTRQAVSYLDRWQERSHFPHAVHWVGSLPDGLSLPPHPRWQAHTRLPAVELRELVGRSCVLVCFSDYEGFGLPPAEAVLAGACPVYSDIPASREVMGERGCPFKNDDEVSFAAALTRAFTIAPSVLRGWGEELLARHDWAAAAARVVAALEAATRGDRLRSGP